MKRLGGLDSLYLSLESATNVFNVGAVAVFDPSTSPPGSPAPHEALCRVLEERLHLLPELRRRLAEVPAGLDRPRWVDVPDVDARRHVVRSALPSPGGHPELCAYVADVLGRPLDRDRPPWEIHVVEGVEDGLVVAVAKIHHAAIDGLGGAALTARLMDLSGETSRVTPVSPIRNAELPSKLQLLTGAGVHLAGLGPSMVAAATRTGTASLRIRRYNRETGGVVPPPLFSAPRATTSTRLSPRKSADMTSLDQSEVQELRTATGTTVNDVVLAVTATALRSFLLERRQLPERPLVAFVPVAATGPDDSRRTSARAEEELQANRLSRMLVSLATTIDDPLARLQAVAEGAARAKTQDRLLGADVFELLAGLVPPVALRAARWLASALDVTSRWPVFNVTVSNFPGAPVPLYCGGARLLTYHPFGPIADGGALNVTATSYCDRLCFGLLACREGFGDVDDLARGFPSALNELSKAAA